MIYSAHLLTTWCLVVLRHRCFSELDASLVLSVPRQDLIRAIMSQYGLRYLTLKTSPTLHFHELVTGDQCTAVRSSTDTVTFT